MKVLLIKDVYKLGRAGEVKKVAAGFGRNYLIPQGLAIPATPGAMQQAGRIQAKATERRAVLNEELGAVAEVLSGITLIFPVKAGETGRLYGSVSNEDLVEAIAAKYEIEVDKRQVETEPIRQLGSYVIPIHLTMDLIPEVKVIIHREGESPEKEVEQEVEEESAAPESVLEVETEPEVEAPEAAEDEPESSEETETEA